MITENVPSIAPNSSRNILIDTHCHLHDREFFSVTQAEDMLARAYEKGVEKIICIGTSPDDSTHARAFAATHDNVFWTFGIHPDFTNPTNPDRCRNDDLEQFDMRYGLELKTSCLFERIRSYGEEERLDPATAGVENAPREKRVKPSALPVAIGEIGLDYHYDDYNRPAQLKLFEQMLQLALDQSLPVSLHIREAFDDALAVLDNFPATRGVVHSFTGSKKDLKKLLACDFYIGVNGLVTYTTPPLPPLEKIVLETDAPFLTPVPFRGTINEPGHVSEVAAYLSGKLGVDLVKVREQTTQNARKIFQI